ncbi:hypothetical protein RAH41_02475 [Gottfriedia acidiceleris]|uniref:hypothetical protein n=1 Tax=Gottfriedia acidiceleris TaxID=371036 RepID=UPI002F265477
MVIKWLKGRNCKHTSLKIEADFYTDPIWCNDCGFNLDIDDFSLTNELIDELFNWIKEYKKIPMDLHNKQGKELTEKVITEIGKDFPVIRFIEQ